MKVLGTPVEEDEDKNAIRKSKKHFTKFLWLLILTQGCFEGEWKRERKRGRNIGVGETHQLIISRTSPDQGQDQGQGGAATKVHALHKN